MPAGWLSIVLSDRACLPFPRSTFWSLAVSSAFQFPICPSYRRSCHRTSFHPLHRAQLLYGVRFSMPPLIQ
jgi:hypothetical protein